MELCEEKRHTSKAEGLGSLQTNPKACLEVETQLQSLGFTMNNGRPMFKLDANTSACLNASVADINNTDFENTLSFEILGKDSLDLIQASTLASYDDIQQKSMTIDYNSMILSLNPSEVHQKLSELLQENNKLKETLKQNNTYMKEQFNTLTHWHQEIEEVQKNHKKKFSETKELIKYLVQENTDLKMKLSRSCIDQSELIDAHESMQMMQSNIATMQEFSILDALQEESMKLDQNHETKVIDIQALIDFCNENDTELKLKLSINDIDHTNVRNIIDVNLAEDQLKATEISIPVTEQNVKIPSLSDESKSSDLTHSDLLASTSELTSRSNSVSPQLSKITNSNSSCESYRMKNEEICSSEKSITVSQNELQPIRQCAAVKSCLEQIVHIFAASKMSKHTNKANKTLDEIHCLVDEMLVKGKLMDSTKKLIEECQKLEREEQSSEIACKPTDSMEPKLENKQSLEEERRILIQERSSLEEEKRSLEEEKRSLEEKKRIFIQERSSLEEEKKLISNQKVALDVEYKDLKYVKELLEQGRGILHEEKMSFDQQCQLYENQKSLLAKEIAKIYILNDTILKKESEIEELRKELDQHEQTISLQQTQLKVYEEDFYKEKKIKESLLEETKRFDGDLQRQIEYNIQLQEEICLLKGKRDRIKSP